MIVFDVFLIFALLWRYLIDWGWVAPNPPVSVQLEVEDATRKLRLGDFMGNPDPALRFSLNQAYVHLIIFLSSQLYEPRASEITRCFAVHFLSAYLL